LNTLGAGADLTPYEAYHHSYGFGLNVGQEINSGSGVFARLGWNDGKTQALEYTDTNWGVSAGVSLDGSLWNRPRQHGGVAFFLSGASKENQDYLRAGGLGILTGDGFLTYGVERSVTPYYDIELVQGLRFAPQYQLTVDPAFNRDRGPISTLMVRVHVER
jgi:high affinity Mn2+ porin